MGLAEYRRKRAFERTPEPASGDRASPGHRPIFVVQLHHARRRHYDLRLQVGDVLKSWAVPKGPSFDPKVKRMAVEVEDHPLEYATFEGEIPKGQYGAGHVVRFDEGTWTTEAPPEAQLEKGDLRFELFGEKLRGEWRLVRTRKPGKQPQWLLFKHRDAYAAELESDDLIDGAPAAPGRARRWAKRAAQLTSSRPASAPIPFEPQLARSYERPPKGPSWLYELKWDGYRLLTTIEGGEVRLFSRNHLEWTDKVPEIRSALERLGLDSAALDGELIANRGAREDFSRLQSILAGQSQGTLSYVLFDVLSVDGVDVSRAPLRERKALLKAMLEGAPARLGFSEHVEDDGPRAFALAQAHGFEGIVAKRADRAHLGARSDEWRKIKHLESDEFAVVGYTPSKKHRRGLGALLLATPDPVHGFRYVGRVGSGFSDELLDELGAELEGEGEAKPSVHVPARSAEVRAARWFPPRLVVEVYYRGLGTSGLLRQPSLKTVRRDKRVVDLEPSPRAETEAATKISSPEKVLFPASGVTKRDVASYYESAMDLVLPELLDRPLTVVRCPNGIGDCFFQKHRTPGFERVGSVRLPASGKTRDLLVVRDVAGLMELVQFNAIELHPWGARAESPERADRIVFDLDPGPGVEWSAVIAAARSVRDLLKRVGLVSFVRTTGGKGLHVVVPLRPASLWGEVRPFTKAFAEGLAGLEPERFVATFEKRARQGKIYVDYLRNVRGATAVASFSLRAREHAPVAMPLKWSELGRVKEGAAFTIQKARARLERLRSHPWEGFTDIEQGLDAVAERLSDQFAT
jgi:bifunctional non-homologous end joining protein LigD